MFQCSLLALRPASFVGSLPSHAASHDLLFRMSDNDEDADGEDDDEDAEDAGDVDVDLAKANLS